MKVVYLGNFSVPYSTESHLKWTWEQLGHEVVVLQENQTTTVDQVVDACRGASLFQVSHTHGWGIRGDMVDMVRRIKASGVKTMSYHLDVYVGLNTWDKREERVGKTWDWDMDYFFTTEGAQGTFFRSRGVRWHHLRPGVVAYGCYQGTLQPGLVCDVGFAGSSNYHPEYPFRPRLVQALQQRYGSRFRLFQGVREQNLNNLYASVKVLVGDHCFAGIPNYWSDRAPETCGRGGFLLYPRTEGLCIPCSTYSPQNLDDLFMRIDYYLAHDAEREEIRQRCFEHVKEHDNYTVLLKEALKVMGLA